MKNELITKKQKGYVTNYKVIILNDYVKNILLCQNRNIDTNIFQIFRIRNSEFHHNLNPGKD